MGKLYTALFSYRFFLILSLLAFWSPQELAAQQDFEKELAEARMVFHRTYYEKASVLFEELTHNYQNKALAHAYMALVEFVLFRDPSIHLEKALTLTQETDADHAIILALCNFASGDLFGCESNVKDYLKADSTDIFGTHLLGMILVAQNKSDEAKIILQKLIAQQGDYYPAYNHLGYAYLRLGHTSEALKTFYSFQKKDSLNPSAYDSVAECLFEMGKNDEAISSLRKAVSLEPYFAYGWEHMGDMYLQMGKTEEAIAAFIEGQKAAKYYGEDFVYSLEQKIQDLKN